jgi:hypothetical protein
MTSDQLFKSEQWPEPESRVTFQLRAVSGSELLQHADEDGSE